MRIKTAVTLSKDTHNMMRVHVCACHPPTVDPDTGILLNGEVEVLFSNGDLLTLRFPMIDDLKEVPALVGHIVQAEVYWQITCGGDLWPWCELRIRFRPDLFCIAEKDPKNVFNSQE